MLGCTVNLRLQACVSLEYEENYKKKSTFKTKKFNIAYIILENIYILVID